MKVNVQEVKQSKSNDVGYTKSILLRDSREYKIEAIFFVIPHSDNKIEISLTINKYNKRNDNVEKVNFKQSELEEFIEYINNNFEPLSKGSTKYLTFDDNNSEKIMNLFLQNDLKATKLLSKLIDSGFNYTELEKIINIKTKQKSIIEFETNISKENTESFWQKWFKSNKWVLRGDIVNILDERNIDTRNICDYLTEAVDGYVDVIELKRPDTPFWNAIEDHDNLIPSQELIKAIIQTTSYLKEIELEANSKKTLDRLGKKILKPRGTLIIGCSRNWSEKKLEAFRLLNATFNNITVLTYDMVLETAKIQLAELEK